MTVARVITRSKADVVEQLELDGDIVVTADKLAAILERLVAGGDPRLLAYELQRDGWLGPLRTRHAWEFLPAARGGPYGSGDRFIEFRAQRAVDPAWPGVVAMESAASVLGLAQRIPEKEVVALPAGEPLPKAMSGQWRVVGMELPATAVTTTGGLPMWTVEGLLVGIAARPSAYQDVAGLAQWLPEAAARLDVSTVITLLGAMSAAARQRTAYLLGVAGAEDASAAVAAMFKPTHTVWFGARRRGGHFDRRSDVNDTMLHQYLGIGTGS